MKWNLDKVIDILEKILEFNKQQKGKGLKILTPKQILQRLPIALVQKQVIQLKSVKSNILCIEQNKLLKSI